MIPVHIIYRTAYTTPKGGIQFRRDHYGRDAKIFRALQAAACRCPGRKLTGPRRAPAEGARCRLAKKNRFHTDLRRTKITASDSGGFMSESVRDKVIAIIAEQAVLDGRT